MRNRQGSRKAAALDLRARPSSESCACAKRSAQTGIVQLSVSRKGLLAHVARSKSQLEVVRADFLCKNHGADSESHGADIIGWSAFVVDERSTLSTVCRLLVAMKLAALVVILSAMSLCGARAEDAAAKNESHGSCMPIGLTAGGELVFPWECREIIEKQRGPVSVNVPNATSDAAPKDQSAQKETRPEQAAATPAPVQPQVAVVTDHPPVAQEANLAPARPATVVRPRPKRVVVVPTAAAAPAAPADRKRQIAAQPQPAPAVARPAASVNQINSIR